MKSWSHQRDAPTSDVPRNSETLRLLNMKINPLAAGAEYIQIFFFFFFFYQHIKYHLLNMLKIKCDINHHYLKTIDLYFIISE